MALSRKFLKAIGLTDEQVESVVEAHTETISGIKSELNAAREKAESYDEVKKELDDLKNGRAENDDYKTKYENEHKAFEDYKSEISAGKLKTAKENAVKSYFEKNGITGDRLKIAMRGIGKELDEVELDGEAIKDTANLDALIKGDYAGLVGTNSTVGVNTAEPPANTGGNNMTREQIMSITDDVTRQTAIAENHSLFGF